jgi:cob(I)alamin adenosyltransferase
MHVAFTGNGKGKTTAAIGNAIRIIGADKRALMVQFIKGPWVSGEDKSAERLGPDFRIIKTGKGFVGMLGDTLPIEEHQKAAEEGLRIAKKEIASGDWHLLMLDEVHNAIALGLIGTAQVIAFLDYAKGKVEHVITTGRDAPKEIIEHADLVTEMKEIKHPYQTGRFAEKGLDF